MITAIIRSLSRILLDVSVVDDIDDVVALASVDRARKATREIQQVADVLRSTSDGQWATLGG
jgi:hypothetical protein